MDKKIVSESIEENVKIISYSDGLLQFIPLEKPKTRVFSDNRSWLQKIYDWWNDSKVKPYAKIQDLSDPIDKRKEDPFDDGSGSKNAIEIGLKVKF